MCPRRLTPAAALGRCGVGHSRFPQSAGPGQSLPGTRTGKGRARETPTPGCAGLRPACLRPHGKCPLGGQLSRPARARRRGVGPGIARQKSGPEARAPREPHLTCRGGSRTAPTNLIDASQLLEGSSVNATTRRSEGTPHIQESRASAQSHPLRRSCCTLAERLIGVPRVPRVAPWAGMRRPFRAETDTTFLLVSLVNRSWSNHERFVSGVVQMSASSLFCQPASIRIDFAKALGIEMDLVWRHVPLAAVLWYSHPRVSVRSTF